MSFDHLIHPANRLSIMAILAGRSWVEFGYIRDAIEVSDSALSKQLTVLEEAEYLESQKLGKGVTRRTRIRITGTGQRAFSGHVAALQDMLGSVSVDASR